MKPEPLDLPPIWRGCTWPAILMTWLDANGAPADLTNWVPFAQTSNGINLNPIIVGDPTAGNTSIHLSYTQTANLKLGKVQWDWVWWFNPSGGGFKYPPFLSGEVEVKEPETSDFTF